VERLPSTSSQQLTTGVQAETYADHFIFIGELVVWRRERHAGATTGLDSCHSTGVRVKAA
jgi:hypothetical protein